MRLIRNFSIIAHVDHGKSTLADRLIQLCGGLAEREMQAQVLDSMALERERGITIKAQSVTLYYNAHDGERYQLNMIDTPGHVDFSYEVSRSLAACDGALLVVDASQGVEAQSVANCYTALEQGLEVLPVINKIDLPSADPERVTHEIEEIIGIEATDAARVSAKTGEGVGELLEQLIRRIPAPRGDPQAPLQALIIDSWFDNYVGVVSLVRVMNGSLQERRQDPRGVHRARAQRRPARPLHPQAHRREGTRHRRRRLRGRRHQGDRRRPGRGHDHAGEPARGRPAPGLQADPAAGVRGPVSREHRRLREIPRRARQAAPE